MNSSNRIALDTLTALATDALVNSNTSDSNAKIVATAVVAADADGLASHDVSRVPFYANQAARGKVDGHRAPLLEQHGAARERVIVERDGPVCGQRSRSISGACA